MSNRPVSPLVEDLRQRIQHLEAGQRRSRSVLPFGVSNIDSRLPGGGLALGALHEVAGGGNGAIDASASALFAAGIAARTKGKVFWFVTSKDLFAPALAQAGLKPDRVIHVEAGDEQNLMACFEEALRHVGLGAVVAEVAHLAMTPSRRLQLAAETGGAIGCQYRLKFPQKCRLKIPQFCRSGHRGELAIFGWSAPWTLRSGCAWRGDGGF